MIDPVKIQADIDSYYASQTKLYPCKSNRPSDMGFPCTRKRVYEFTNWQDKIKDPKSQPRMSDGKIHEMAVIDILQKAGYQISSHDTPFHTDRTALAKYNISGRIDGKIVDKDDRTKEYPVEIKAISPYAWADMKQVSDMKFSDAWWERGYYVQIQIYLLMTETEKGFFILKDKVSGQLKFLETPLDYEFCEKILKETEEVNQHVANKTLPDKVNDPGICPRCPFVHICMPDYATAGIEFIEDRVLLEKIRRYEELKGSMSEYNALDKMLKDQLKEKQMSIGEFLITGKWVERKEMPAQPATKYWAKKIQRIDKTGAAVSPGDGTEKVSF